MLESLPDDIMQLVVSKLPYTDQFCTRRVNKHVHGLANALLQGLTRCAPKPSVDQCIIYDHPDVSYDEVYGR